MRMASTAFGNSRTIWADLAAAALLISREREREREQAQYDMLLCALLS